MIIKLEQKVKNIEIKKKIEKTYEALERTMNVKFEEFGKRIKDLESSQQQKDLIINNFINETENSKHPN